MRSSGWSGGRSRRAGAGAEARRNGPANDRRQAAEAGTALLKREFPPAFVERYSRFIPDFDVFLEAMSTPLKRTIRVNTLKAEPGRVAEMMADAGPAPLAWTDVGFTIERGEGLGRRLEHFLGLVYVQEAASMVPPLVLAPRPGERVLDLAAAPGSKTTQMAAMMANTGLVVANDPSPARVRGLIGNVDRAGCLNVAVTRMEGTRLARQLAGTCDRVLVDAPCSSEATTRKSNQVLDHWTPELCRRFAVVQKGLIVAGFRALRPGGTMVYSTCTVAPEENEAVVAYLLSREPGAELCDASLPGLRMRPALAEWEGASFPGPVAKARRILPQDNDTEAFFVALVRKREDAPV